MSSKSSRVRKQRFPRSDRRVLPIYSRPSIAPIESDITPSDDEDASSTNSKRSRSIHTSVVKQPSVNRLLLLPPTSESRETSAPPCRVDKRARDEHNEQERSRRRELAVIYELIRSSFSEDDLRYVGQCNGPRSVDKLSYPQVLHVAYHLLKKEQHHLTLFEKMLTDLKRIEREFVGNELPVLKRPNFPPIAENYRKVIGVVDDLLKDDKSSRNMTGLYETTPAQRAAQGNHQLCLLNLQAFDEPDTPASYISNHQDILADRPPCVKRIRLGVGQPRVPSKGVANRSYVYLMNKPNRQLKRSSSSSLLTQNRRMDSTYDNLNRYLPVSNAPSTDFNSIPLSLSDAESRSVYPDLEQDSSIASSISPSL